MAQIEEGSWLERFIVANESLSAQEICDNLMCDTELQSLHKATETQGDSNVTSNTEAHFVTYVEHNGKIWELDG